MASATFPLFMLTFYLSNDSFVNQSALLPSNFLVAHICNSEDPVSKRQIITYSIWANYSFFRPS